ncbi:MAG: class IV adenylate cyclase [Chitinophagaceae bacterium]|nr:class IV adenylate cyclase [Chitinophagaceae bacterium]
MNIRNFEFKARVPDTTPFEEMLLKKEPVFKGIDHQIDTYFNVPKGRLKLREGNIEHALIQYDREDLAGSKLSRVVLYRHSPDPALKQILTHQFGVKTIVDKHRKIYFIGNVKFHFDRVEGLGQFVEVEAIDSENKLSTEELKKQCDGYFQFFGLKAEALQDRSYSDMLLQ